MVLLLTHKIICQKSEGYILVDLCNKSNSEAVVMTMIK